MQHLDRRLLLAGLAGSAVSGCGSGSWFGGAEDAPLPGARVPVMLLEDRLEADPSLAGLTIELPPAQPNPEWPQAGGNAAHALHHPAVAATIREAWSADIGAGASGGARLLAGPVVAGGRVFTVDADGLFRAFGTADGDEAWYLEPEGLEDNDRLRGGGLAFGDGRLFAALGDGTVLALDPQSGAEMWRQTLRAPVRAAPCSAPDRLLVTSADNQLFALLPATGEILWRHAGLFEQAGILGGASPAADEGTAVAAYSSGEVFALDLETGQPLWSETVLRPRRTLAIGAILDIVGDPVIDRDRVIVAGVGGETAAFDLARGTRTWSAEVTSTQMPWAAGDYVFLLTERNELACLLRQGGRIRWVSQLALSEDPEDLDSGRILWSGPVLAGNRLLVASSLGEVASLSPYTGEVLSTVELGGPVTLPPVVADGTAYFLTNDGELLAYR